MTLEDFIEIAKPHNDKLVAEATAERYRKALEDIAQGNVPNSMLEIDATTKEQAQAIFRERFMVWAQQRARAALG